MSYTLKQVKAGWEIQNGSSITVTVPDLKSVELAIEMLTRKPEPAVKKAAPSMILRKDEFEDEDEDEDEDEEISPKDALTAVLKKSKKALTAKEIIDKINPEDEDEDEDEEISPKAALAAVLKKSKKALTAKEIIDKINPEADEAAVKNFHQILSTLGKSKVLKRKKNEHNIFAYSVK